MYYYRKGHNSSKGELTDEWVHTRDYNPKELFEKHNNIYIWWHVNDATGKIDRNINLSDRDSRKAMAT